MASKEQRHAAIARATQQVRRDRTGFLSRAPRSESATLDKPPCTHREVQPVRECAGCGCWLRSYGNASFCDPCSKPSLSKEDHAEIFARISEMRDPRERRRAFEALADLVEGAE